MKISLHVLTAGKSEGKLIPITLSQFLIGRDPECHLRPASGLISKRHCAILTRGDKVFARDFDSTNGTFINDEPLKGEREVKHDDMLKVGPLQFKVVIDAGAPATKAAGVKPASAAATPAVAAKPAEGATATKTAPVKAAPPPPKEESGEDDDIAAMLLSLDGDGPNGEREEVPSGTTVMDIVAPTVADKPDGGKPGAKPEEKKKRDESTSNAAKAILEKYMKRPRG